MICNSLRGCGRPGCIRCYGPHGAAEGCKDDKGRVKITVGDLDANNWVSLLTFALACFTLGFALGATR